MPTHEELQRAHRCIDRAEELYRHSASACAVSLGLGMGAIIWDVNPWACASVFIVAAVLHLMGKAYLRAAAGLRSRP